MKANPPKWADVFINWLTDNGSHADIPGDLWEEFDANAEAKGIRYARRRYVWTVITCLRPFILKGKFNFITGVSKPMMFKNYWIVTRRYMLKNKLYTTINVFGLAIGIACSLVLLVYVSNELSFDRFHIDGENIYRLLITDKSPEGESTSSTITAAIAPTLKEELPEVTNYVRFSYPNSGFLARDQKKVKVENITYTDSTIFEVFSFHLLEGDIKSSLANPYSIVLTPAVAKSIFGEEEPMGKQVLLNGEKPYLVTAIVKAPPVNSQIQFSCLLSFSTLEEEGYFLDWNGGWNYFEYIKLAPHTDLGLLACKFPPLMERHINNMLKQYKSEWNLSIQPLFDVHLGKEIEGDWFNKGSMQYIYIFGAIAFLTLVMASINFINLTASQALTRLKEIGIRKAVGANQRMLIYQFFFESFIFTLIAFSLAIILIASFYNIISEFLGYELEQIYFGNVWLGLIIGLVILVVSIGSGAYPAFYLSGLSSVNSLQGNSNAGHISKPKKVDSLVVFQFLISIMLISGTWFINNQLKYIQNKGLGYDKENVLILDLNSKDASANLMNMRTALAAIPEVLSTGASSALPGNGLTSNGYVPEGKELPIMLHAIDVDDSYLSTMHIPILAGRNFSDEIASDKHAFLVNETLVNELGWQNPIGKIIKRNGNHKVIGVVRDFNYASLHEKIEPLVLTQSPWHNQFNYLSVRVSGNNISATIAKIEQAWRAINPADPFEFNFLDQQFSSLYYREQQQAKLLFTFSLLAILIASMGLFGLVSFSLKQKIKEIGVRKVLGATATNLLVGISKKYIYSIVAASIIAIPVIYLLMERWLNNFYYHIKLSPVVLLLTVVMVLVIGFVTINIQTLHAIRQNPTESLKYE